MPLEGSNKQDSPVRLITNLSVLYTHPPIAIGQVACAKIDYKVGMDSSLFAQKIDSFMDQGYFDFLDDKGRRKIIPIFNVLEIEIWTTAESKEKAKEEVKEIKEKATKIEKEEVIEPEKKAKKKK